MNWNQFFRNKGTLRLFFESAHRQGAALGHIARGASKLWGCSYHTTNDIVWINYIHTETIIITLYFGAVFRNEWDAKRNSPGLPSELGHLRRLYVSFFEKTAMSLKKSFQWKKIFKIDIFVLKHVLDHS